MQLLTKGFKLRTITCFIAAVPDSDAGWEKEISNATSFLKQAQQLYEGQGATFPLPLWAAAMHPMMHLVLSWLQVTRCRHCAFAPERFLQPLAATMQQRWHRGWRHIAVRKASRSSVLGAQAMYAC
jgi:hypothetical protein